MVRTGIQCTSVASQRWSAKKFGGIGIKMLTMSTLMMPAATMTTMTNAGPIPVAAAGKLEPKLLQLPHPALMQQLPQQLPQQMPQQLPQQPLPQQHHHQHQHNNNKLGEW